jgi:predicted amidohydrolase
MQVNADGTPILFRSRALAVARNKSRCRIVPMAVHVAEPKPRICYYEIVSGFTKGVIGHCTSEGIEHAAKEDPGTTFRRITRRQFEKATSA